MRRDGFAQVITDINKRVQTCFFPEQHIACAVAEGRVNEIRQKSALSGDVLFVGAQPVERAERVDVRCVRRIAACFIESVTRGKIAAQVVGGRDVKINVCLLYTSRCV